MGYAVAPFDYREISNKIKLIIHNYDNLTQYIAQLPLDEEFSWDKIADQYINLYKKINRE